MPISPLMKLSHSMAELYNVIEQLQGPAEARHLITTIISSVIHDIQEEGVKLTHEELEKRINHDINDFLEAAKKTNVA